MCNAKPCVDCLKLIRLYGIKKIYYSNEQGVIQREDV
jgi:deoxycytidylate deaminase